VTKIKNNLRASKSDCKKSFLKTKKTRLLIKRGSVLAYSLIVLAMMVAIVATMSATTIIEKKSAGSTDFSVQAYQTADSGVQLAIKKINNNTTGTIADAFDSCSSGIAQNLSDASVGLYDLSFYSDTTGTTQITDCDAQVDTIRKVKSIGKFNNTIRAVSVAINNFLSCGTDQVFDTDGNSYNTVLVDDQCWMASNLRVGTVIGSKLADNVTLQNQTDNSIIEKYCYGYVQEGDASQKAAGIENCDTDGGLYQWEEAMQYSDTPEAQGICPVGWHMPIDAEQYALENYLKDTDQTCDTNRHDAWDCSTAGTKLKSDGTSDMNFLLVGYCGIDGSFNGRASDAYAWSSSENDSSAWYRILNSSNAMVYRTNSSKSYGFSVRCIKDQTT